MECEGDISLLSLPCPDLGAAAIIKVRIGTQVLTIAHYTASKPLRLSPLAGRRAVSLRLRFRGIPPAILWHESGRFWVSAPAPAKAATIRKPVTVSDLINHLWRRGFLLATLSERLDPDAEWIVTAHCLSPVLKPAVQIPLPRRASHSPVHFPWLPGRASSAGHHRTGTERNMLSVPSLPD